MEAFSKDPFEPVEAWIISSDEGKVMGVTGQVGEWCWNDAELRIAVSGLGGQEAKDELHSEIRYQKLMYPHPLNSPKLSREERP